jgi:uncharacterized protein (TIGR02217 family)
VGNSVFPTFAGIAWPVRRIPKFNTKVKETVSGKECRASFTAYPKYEIDLVFDYLSLDDYKTLGGFFKLRKGKFDSFLFLDPDESTVTAQSIGTGNGVTKQFQLVRTSGGFTEPCENVGTVSVYQNGVLQGNVYTITATGIVDFGTAPANGVAVTWTGTYYWRVRFNQDTAEFAQNMKTFFEMKKLSMVGATGNKV